MPKTGARPPKTTATRSSPTEIRFLRLPELARRFGCSEWTIRGWVKKGHFPAPTPLSDRVMAWPESTVTTWEAERIALTRKRAA